ncbi:MAG: hypothetical protein ABDH61_03200 [Acidilobaceae archaeon]
MLKCKLMRAAGMHIAVERSWEKLRSLRGAAGGKAHRALRTGLQRLPCQLSHSDLPPE